MPSSDFSKPNICKSGHSSISGIFSSLSVEKRVSCAVSIFLPGLLNILSKIAVICARFKPKLSIAPDFMRLSTTFLFATRESTLSQKSKMLSNLFAILVFIILSKAAWPTFLIALSPNLILVSSVTVKLAKLVFISGGKTFIFIKLDSLTYSTTLSVLLRSLVRRAAINSTG